MPSWVVQCSKCKSEFVHSTIADKGSYLSFLWPFKPELRDGTALKCPSCGTVGNYGSTDLMYRA